MKTIYKCEICDYDSENKEKVQKCEAQGRKNKFSVGDQVYCLWCPEGYPISPRIRIKTKIRRVYFAHMSHEVGYQLTTSDTRVNLQRLSTTKVRENDLSRIRSHIR